MHCRSGKSNKFPTSLPPSHHTHTHTHLRAVAVVFVIVFPSSFVITH